MTGAEFEGVDFDLLADYVGGALDGTPDQERVAGLLATDETWRAAYEALEPAMIAVGGVLREFEPAPMPDDLAARLDGLFRTPLAPEGEAEPVPSKVVDFAKARRRRRWVAPLTVAAAAVAFAGFGVNSFLTSDATDAGADMASSENAPKATGGEAIGGASRSDADYTESTLAQAAPGQMRTMGGSAQVPAAAPGAETQASQKDLPVMPTDVAACVDEITRANSGGVISVEFMDYARFEGSPALIVRFSAANGVWVWAVGPRCGTPGAGADELERVPVR
ncbi:hypothetical protein [Actinoplanes philippinensis]|uniref:hypothetical protein n=1 Tax=Actinoplanes philippinensis TaxID=35752 RepID=UPI0034069FC6